MQFALRFKAPAPPRVLVRWPELPEREAAEWQQRLNALRDECGCADGANAMAVFTGVYAAWVVASHPASFFWTAGVFVTGLILSALGGKLFGLARARAEFHRTCRRLELRLATYGPGNRGAESRNRSLRPPG